MYSSRSVLLLALVAIALAKRISHRRIVFGSCNHAEKESLWGVIEEHAAPHELILLGDNIYTDTRDSFGSFVGSDEANFKRQYALLDNDSDWRSLLSSLDHKGSRGNDQKDSSSSSIIGNDVDLTMSAVHATYDDHDFGINNGDKSFPLRKYSMHAFWDFMHVPKASPVRKQQGVYSSKIVQITNKSKITMTKAAAAAAETSEVAAAEEEEEEEERVLLTYQVIMLDARSNKDVPGTRNGDFLGQEQWLWLEKQLLGSSEDEAHDDSAATAAAAQAQTHESRSLPVVDVVFIGSGIQVLPNDKILEETWSDFPQARQRLLDLVANAKAKHVFLLSGDVHTGEVLQAKCSFNQAADAAAAAVDKTLQKQQKQDGHEEGEGEGEDTCIDGSCINNNNNNNNSSNSNKFTLWEFTSSGLSHTFTQSTRRNKQTSNAASTSTSKDSTTAKDESSNKNSSSLMKSKGWFLETVYDMYTATGASHFRQHRFGDHYKGLHYGLIDINSETEEGATTKTKTRKLFLDFSIVDHQGRAVAVMTRRFSLSSDGDGGNERLMARKLAISSNNSNSNKKQSIHCEAYWGETPTWRILLARASLATIPFIVVVLPFFVVLWLLFASCLYIWWGAEQKRREDIEDYRRKKLTESSK